MVEQLPDHVAVTDRPDRFGLRVHDSELWMDGVPLSRIAAEHGTPTYAYAASEIEARFDALAQAVGQHPTTLCYAVKANGALAVLRLLARRGAGADIVSGGELTRALRAGIPADKIVFSGVGKSNAELDAAITAGLRSINLESVEELEQVSARARALGRQATVSLRVNPDIDPETHPYLATGLQQAKFGIAMADAPTVARRAHADPHVTLRGIGCHIGSQITSARPFVDSIKRLRGLWEGLAAEGVELPQLDLGGGMGIPYRAEDPDLDVRAWGRAVDEATAGLPVELVLEPGRFLVGNAGVLLTRVLGRKQGEAQTDGPGDARRGPPKKRFVIVDAAMNDLVRPALYEAYHIITPVSVPERDAATEEVDVVGPVCESGDFLALARTMPITEPGQVLAVLSAGAYGMSMASNYNTRPLPAEVLVAGEHVDVLRPRQTVDELLAAERMPAWLADRS
ncbi:diaminopimelate decarboxylase [Paraliomyxa miuraensis]|uniref:diaminopimelate decarboxylase n=1 Tax=Paraliomyxa miuraensis TaxID=376150 RepID=UPI0022583E0D|nr:diaminopimelate decarboxylase [Paraliomyxa miuraensis]MCX4246273.1 diaminopimelate decarboxylase [Paraliomyxa miuraensis]